MKIVHDEYYQPNDFIFYGKEKNDFYIGVELEVNTKKFETDNLTLFLNDVNESDNFLYFKDDCSVCNGVEIVSHPATIQYHKNSNEWKQIFEKINKYNITYGYNCGLHFHITRSFFSLDNIQVMDYFINSRDKIVTLLKKIGGREFSWYCQRINKNINSWGMVSGDHFSSFNFANRKTLEFRFCNTTNDINTFFKRMELIYCIANFSKQYIFPEIVEMTTDNIYNEFKKFIFNNNVSFIKRIDFK